MEPKKAEELYNRFVDLVKESIHDKDAVSSGVFGADMEGFFFFFFFFSFFLFLFFWGGFLLCNIIKNEIRI